MVILETKYAGAERFGSPVQVAETEAIDLPDGRRLRVSAVGDWVRVSVANDWSVPYIYGLLTLGIVTMTLAHLVPARRATIVFAGDSRGGSSPSTDSRTLMAYGSSTT